MKQMQQQQQEKVSVNTDLLNFFCWKWWFPKPEAKVVKKF